MNTTLPVETGLGTFYVPGSGVRLTVFRDIAPILIGFAIDFHESIETLQPGQCWGDVAGHGIHLNYGAHRRGVAATFSTRQMMTIGRLMDKWSLSGRSLIAWGDQENPRRQAYFRLDVTRDIWEPAIALLQSPVPEGVEPRQPVPYAGAAGTRVLRLRIPGMRGNDVVILRDCLYAKGQRSAFQPEDRDTYGPWTAELVRQFQLEHGLPATGVVGGDTWPVLLG